VHDEDEFVYVLAGEVCVELDGAVSLLVPAQSAYYRGGIRHRWWSAGGGAYRLLVVKQGRHSARPAGDGRRLRLLQVAPIRPLGSGIRHTVP
jgi:quercetin dioxygenase-like cupin family protein